MNARTSPYKLYGQILSADNGRDISSAHPSVLCDKIKYVVVMMGAAFTGRKGRRKASRVENLCDSTAIKT